MKSGDLDRPCLANSKYSICKSWISLQLAKIRGKKLLIPS